MDGLRDWRVRKLLAIRRDDWVDVFDVRCFGVCPCAGCDGDILFFRLRSLDSPPSNSPDSDGGRTESIEGGAFCVACGFSNAVGIPLDVYEDSVVIYG